MFCMFRWEVYLLKYKYNASISTSEGFLFVLFNFAALSYDEQALCLIISELFLMPVWPWYDDKFI